MHINVSEILAQDIGYNTSFEIAGEHPKLEDVILTSDLNGRVDIVRATEGLQASGVVQTAVELECHRCLRAFAYPLSVKLNGEFRDQPNEEQWPIERDGTINIVPMIRQELIVNVPIKQLCKPDCLGLCEVCGQPQDQPHHH